MSYIITLRGNRFDYLSPSSNIYDFEEIAECLSKEQRFGNHLNLHWSVAQHSLLVHYLLFLQREDNDTLKWAIHHDDLEAYFKDLPTPLKQLLPDYQKLYKEHEYEYIKYLELPYGVNKLISIKKADLMAMYIESCFLTMNSSPSWHDQTRASLSKMDSEMYDGNIMRYVQKLMLMNEQQVKERLLSVYEIY